MKRVVPPPRVREITPVSAVVIVRGLRAGQRAGRPGSAAGESSAPAPSSRSSPRVVIYLTDIGAQAITDPGRHAQRRVQPDRW
jgi:hypothetical protein